MRKQFKLKAFYPGSPKELGKIIKPKGNSENHKADYYWEGSWFDPLQYPEFWKEIKQTVELKHDDLVYRIWNNGEKSLGQIVVRGSTLFFKALENYFKEGSINKNQTYGLGAYKYEVVKKDYEILSLKATNKQEFYDLNEIIIISNSDYSEEMWINDGNCIKNNCFIIHSVKRLSDGEIFTIGDKNKNGIIKSIFVPFEFGTTTVCIQCDNKKGIYLKDITKAKQPLFTTEDGVDIFEGDTFYIVDNWIPIIYVNYVSINEYIHNLKFSTKEKAEEYILMNEPCLSINDLMLFNKRFRINILLKEKLIELVKEKLKN